MCRATTRLKFAGSALLSKAKLCLLRSELSLQEMQMTSLKEQIERAKAELQATKPRSRRHVELEMRLQMLRTKQLRYENLINAIEAA